MSPKTISAKAVFSKNLLFMHGSSCENVSSLSVGDTQQNHVYYLTQVRFLNSSSSRQSKSKFTLATLGYLVAKSIGTNGGNT